MIIQTNQNGEIIQFITVGDIPEGTPDHYYIDEKSVSEEILRHIFDYRYVDGKFIPKVDVDSEHLEEFKKAKINNMRFACNQVIEKGIDWNGDHYSLEQTDQINLMKLDDIARRSATTTPIMYHADGQLCRAYSQEEITRLAGAASKWVSYHTTYFNYLKATIQDMTTVEEVTDVHYGMRLNDSYMNLLNEIADGEDLLVEVEDDYDYRYTLGELSFGDIADCSAQFVPDSSIDPGFAQPLPNSGSSIPDSVVGGMYVNMT